MLRIYGPYVTTFTLLAGRELHGSWDRIRQHSANVKTRQVIDPEYDAKVYGKRRATNLKTAAKTQAMVDAFSAAQAHAHGHEKRTEEKKIAEPVQLNANATAQHKVNMIMDASGRDAANAKQ